MLDHCVGNPRESLRRPSNHGHASNKKQYQQKRKERKKSISKRKKNGATGFGNKSIDCGNFHIPYTNKGAYISRFIRYTLAY